MVEGFLALHAPRIPRRESFGERMSPFAASAAVHALGFVALLATITGGAASPPPAAAPAPHEAHIRLPAPRIVFLPAHGPGGGGGGGGNRQRGPIRRAERVGRDRMTLPVARPPSLIGQLTGTPAPAQQLLLDAKPLGSGVMEQIGALEGGVGSGTSQGPGEGGGVGDGVGTGVGSGLGPGLGPGSGGGTGGGAHRPGGLVTPPILLLEVRPTYTDEALRKRIQGSVMLELIVRSDGQPTDIRVTRSLDPYGLDQEAVRAVQRWRFVPGRFAGEPVDVAVTVLLDFSIR